MANQFPNLNINPFGFPPQNPAIRHLSFDQDRSCFAVGLDTGFVLYNIEPFHLLSDHGDTINYRGIDVVTMQRHPNYYYICLVGGEPEPAFPRNRMTIMNVYQPELSKCLPDAMSPPLVSPVINLKVRRDLIVAVTETCIRMYIYPDGACVCHIGTCMNMKGLFEISNAPAEMVVAYPGVEQGHVTFLYASGAYMDIPAFTSMINCMNMTPNGSSLALAGDGSKIKVYNTHNGQREHEIDTGYIADIYSLSLSAEANWLAMSSERGIVTVFSLKGTEYQEIQASLQVPIGETTAATFRVPQGLPHIVTFGWQDNIVVIIAKNGWCYVCRVEGITDQYMTPLRMLNFMAP